MKPLADWQDESAYPSTEPETSMSRWHWEFLRRSPHYQADYTRFSRFSGTSEEGRREREAIARRYGLDGIMLDYRDPLTSLFCSPRDPGAIRSCQWQAAWEEDEDGIRKEVPCTDLDYLDPKIRQHELCVVFNLRHPLDSQLDAARQALLRAQVDASDRCGPVTDFSRLLRMLDAEAASVDEAEMTRFFFPGADDRLGRKRTSEELRRAKRLRDVDHRFI
ncbi:MAG: hypothetical protein DRQ37_01765 [Gammaproteobacteria bacterium]|nr:MAG: hypothetical protein DRQ37_01765 [Gammaproteobacteria bacterium]